MGQRGRAGRARGRCAVGGDVGDGTSALGAVDVEVHLDAGAGDGLPGLALHEHGEDLEVALVQAHARQAAVALDFHRGLDGAALHILVLGDVGAGVADGAFERRALRLVVRALLPSGEVVELRALAIQHGGELAVALRGEAAGELLELRLGDLHGDGAHVAALDLGDVALGDEHEGLALERLAGAGLEGGVGRRVGGEAHRRLALADVAGADAGKKHGGDHGAPHGRLHFDATI
mmetsp:Transcript_59815/g.175488  ORF Transcript_59815/g.175488 Transcript_59815/m.175488 type:complete len:234 (+) Transcript_59815:178-879(+)